MRCAELEERIPWTAVKKSWITRRGDWVKSVQATLQIIALSKLLVMLEGALKTEALAPTWGLHRAAWRGRTEAGQLPNQLDASVRELEENIQWSRVAQAELAAGLGRALSTGVPQPLGDLDDDAAAAAEPPPGLPRSALRVLLLLRAMGVRQYEPGVVLQLLELMNAYTSDVLTDAQILARTRQRGAVQAAAATSRMPLEVQQQALAAALEACVEPSDLALSVKGRTARGFIHPPARELLSQQASELNVQPMPLLPRNSGVQLPPTAQWVPSARQIAQEGDVDESPAWFE